MYTEHIPDNPLRSRLECVWTNCSTSTANHTVYPDGCMDILYTRYGNHSQLQVVGTMTAPRRFTVANGTQFTGLRFHPGKAPSLPAAQLVDQTASLTDVLSAPGLQQKLDDSPNPAAILSAWLAARIKPPSPVELALGFLESGRDLDAIATQANLSVRQFRRRCAELTGLSPRHLARILRFRKALAASLPSPRPNWSAIALDAGYFDQAHLIRDFREFAGATPMAVFSNTKPSTSV